MDSQTIVFKELHTQEEPLLLGNVWDVQSARVLEKLGFKAIGTSSAAVAEMLGYKDGEGMPFEEYFFIVKRIKQSTGIPFTVDLEGGYGKTDAAIVKNIQRLSELGVAGINFEDSVVSNGARTIVSAEAFASKLNSIVSQLRSLKIDIFINVRCDAFLLGLAEARKEALRRIALYEKTGVHGIFLPCITADDDIRAATQATPLPVNVMCMPALPGFDQLKSLGVKRISMGNFVNGAIYKRMEELCAAIIREKNFAPMF
jgi:2-methylisocitrate lyase-like PEP mutase family enzyme